MITLPEKPERVGYDQIVEDNVLHQAIKDLELFSIEVKDGESILARWLKEYNENILFTGLINELSRRERNRKKQRPLTMQIKETAKGGDKHNGDVYTLHIFNKKKRKKIRRRIPIE